MSDYGSLYLIDTSYNSERDATEVIFGYAEMEKEKQIKGRMMSVRIAVNIPGCGDNKSKAVERGLKKAWRILASASQAPFDDS